MAFRLERKTNTLFVEGFWLEAGHPPDDTNFQQALQCGLAHFARFHNSARVCIAAEAKPTSELRVLLNNCLKSIDLNT